MSRECLICATPFALKWSTSDQEFCSPDCQKEGRRQGLVTLKPWTDDEMGYLQGLAHLSARAAGEVLGRSAQSVQHKRRDLANGWSPIRQRVSDDELDIVRSTPHMTAEQVAKSLGTATSRIVRMRSHLRATEGMAFGEHGSHKSPHEVGTRRLLAKTCLGCGLLLDGSWFSWSNDGQGNPKNWKPRCNRCHSQAAVKHKDHKSGYQKDGGKSARATFAKLQAFTLERATRHREPWIDSDHIVLRDPDLTAFEKALRLGRSIAATYRAVSANGYTSRVGRGDPMKGVWVIDNPNAPTSHAA